VGKNFVYQLVRKLRANEQMNVPQDQVNTPTYNRDLADATRRLVEKGAAGLFNIGGSQVLGRLDFAKEVVEALNALSIDKTKLLSADLLSAVTTSNSGQAALRPLASGLKLDRLQAEIPDWKPRSVKEAMADWMGNPTGKMIGE